jgi:hypothetical protein
MSGAVVSQAPPEPDPAQFKVVIALQKVSMWSGPCGSCNLNPAICSCAFVEKDGGWWMVKGLDLIFSI